MTDSRPKNLRDVSASSQCRRLLERLRAGPINSFEITAELNICRPGARISELRAEGHPIRTHRATIEDAYGYKHPGVATYYLSTEPVAEVA